jgi:hypothetical protein
LPRSNSARMASPKRPYVTLSIVAPAAFDNDTMLP